MHVKYIIAIIQLGMDFECSPLAKFKYLIIYTFVEGQPPLKLFAQNHECTHICGITKALILSYAPIPFQHILVPKYPQLMGSSEAFANNS